MILYYMLTLFIFQTAADKNTLPVFMIDQEQAMVHLNLGPNPFEKMSTSKFADIIHDAIRHSAGVIIFVEEHFSVEDISLKDKRGSPYQYLRQNIREKKAKYFPAVIDPYRLLTQIFQPQQYNVFHLRSRTKLELMDSFKYIYIYFQDGMNETRIDVLRRHDLIIREVSHLVRQMKTGPIVAFYTGKVNPVEVEKLRFVPIKPIPLPKDLGVMVVSSGALFRFSDVYASTPTRRAVFNQLPMIAEETWSRRTMSTKMAYTDFELEFNFNFQEHGWVLDNVALLEAGEEVGRTVMRVGAPWNMSYVCAEPLVIVNTRDGSSVTISQYQVQPRLTDYRRRVPGGGSPVDLHEGSINFGRSTNCGPYFNIAILSCLMITFLCLTICMYGIVNLMDCRSNDRYDDPNAKQLVISEN
ncbi:uncharacterized protein LOC142985141 [Anticarsia gemmatalis]|uniref:uncharacterized protein LOC142985141 n=1 Tax=Anticarsia gemmatalis TaxID=129554 RepID=UPI003F7681F7